MGSKSSPVGIAGAIPHPDGLDRGRTTHCRSFWRLPTVRLSHDATHLTRAQTIRLGQNLAGAEGAVLRLSKGPGCKIYALRLIRKAQKLVIMAGSEPRF
jgi:hypothetical protein